MKFGKALTSAALTLGALAGSAIANAPATVSDAQIAAKAGHEIRMYSRYSIWDNINLRVNNGNVELVGEVNEPYKKADLGRIVQHVAGVSSITNELKVLPLSPFDNQIRAQVARAIYRDPVLSRYSMQVVPPIHIIVDNGHVSLEGVVNNTMEKNVAGIRAGSAGLSLGPVVNNLRVENQTAKN